MPINQSHSARIQKQSANLITLLDFYQNKSSIQQFRRSISDTKNQNRPGTTILKRFALNDINNPIFKPLIFHTNDQFLQDRTAHTSRTKIADRQIKTLQQAKKQKMISMLSTQNFRKQLMNTRKMSAVQSQYRSNETKIQKYKKQHNFKFNILGNKQIQQKVIEGQQISQQDKFTSLQLIKQIKRNRFCKQPNLQQNFLTSPRDPKKQYLKKNTSINKSIMNSIIKLKLSKNLQQNSPQEAIRSDQIVKMIKVYKGIQPANDQQKYSTSQNNNIKDKHLHIQGWHNQSEIIQINADVVQTPRITESISI